MSEMSHLPEFTCPSADRIVGPCWVETTHAVEEASMDATSRIYAGVDAAAFTGGYYIFRASLLRSCREGDR